MEQMKEQLSNKLNEVLEQQTIRQFVMFIATAFAIVIGTSQFFIRSWKENDMSTKLRSFILKTLAVIDKISAGVRDIVEANSSLV